MQPANVQATPAIKLRKTIDMLAPEQRKEFFDRGFTKIPQVFCRDDAGWLGSNQPKTATKPAGKNSSKKIATQNWDKFFRQADDKIVEADVRETLRDLMRSGKTAETVEIRGSCHFFGGLELSDNRRTRVAGAGGL